MRHDKLRARMALLTDAIRWRERDIASRRGSDPAADARDAETLRALKSELGRLHDRRLRRPWPVQAFRGMRTLPHVGAHPGNEMMWLFLAMGAIAPIGCSESVMEWVALAPVGVGIILLGMGPLYLCGCAGRANLSDRMADAGR